MAVAGQRIRQRLRILERGAALGPEVDPRIVQPPEILTAGLERGLDLLPQVLGLADGRRGVVGDAPEGADEGGGHEPVVPLDLRAAGGASVGRGHARPSMLAPGRASASTASAR
jgi:hypothetical protein